MTYPEDFIKKCKKTYPEWIVLHEMLDQGRQGVAVRLRDKAESAFQHLDIDVLESNTIEEAKQKVYDVRNKKELYRVCCTFCE